MTTVSDYIPAAERRRQTERQPLVDEDNDAGARTGGHARARARIPITQLLRADLAGSWVWRDAPPSLRQVIAGWTPAADRVPAGSMPLRAMWAVWNACVAVPTTAVLYVLAWMLQHPARAVVLAVVAGPIGFMWIANK